MCCEIPTRSPGLEYTQTKISYDDDHSLIISEQLDDLKSWFGWRIRFDLQVHWLCQEKAEGVGAPSACSSDCRRGDDSRQYVALVGRRQQQR